VSAVVSDSSPLICLCYLRREHILKELFSDIYVPPAVAAELRKPHPPLGGLIAQDIPGVHVQAPQKHPVAVSMADTLHEGELQAMALALELHADLLIIDEAAGRRAAQLLQIPIIGTCGILVRANRQRLMGPVRPLLDALRAELQFFISDELYRHTLDLAGES
jgi:predicted nucleic acid-binding protein